MDLQSATINVIVSYICSSCGSKEIAQYLHKKTCLYTWIQRGVQFYVADSCLYNQEARSSRLLLERMYWRLQAQVLHPKKKKWFWNNMCMVRVHLETGMQEWEWEWWNGHGLERRVSEGWTALQSNGVAHTVRVCSFLWCTSISLCKPFSIVTFLVYNKHTISLHIFYCYYFLLRSPEFTI